MQNVSQAEDERTQEHEGRYGNLSQSGSTSMEDMETMIEMGYEENDPEIIPEIQEMLDEFQKNFDSIRDQDFIIRRI